MSGLLSQDPAMLASIYHQYPHLGNFYGNNFKTFDVTSQRAAQGPDYVQNRQSEFYFPGDSPRGYGGPQGMLPHPAPGYYALEFYNPDTMNNRDVRRSLTLGEMLHGLHNDPQWEQLRQQFNTQFSPQADRVNHKVYMDQRESENETFPQFMNRMQTDAYLRSSFLPNPQSTAGLHPQPWQLNLPEYQRLGGNPGRYDYFNTNEWRGLLSPAQVNTLQLMQNYLKTGILK